MDKLHPSPEMRACFAADAQSTLQKIQQLLPTLDRVTPEFSQIQPLSDTLHSLRGAASLIGGQALSAFLADLERLLEIAASFQFGAVDRARHIFHLIQEVLPRLPETLHHTLADQPAEAEQCRRVAHDRILRDWGDYFCNADTGLKAPPEPGCPSPETEAVQTARQFLESLGLDPSCTEPRPAPPAAGLGTPHPLLDPAEPAFGNPDWPVQSPEKPAAPEPTVARSVVPFLDTQEPEALAWFIQEMEECLDQLDEQLSGWDRQPGDKNAAYAVYRLVHTLKGAANSVGLAAIGTLLHHLEDLLERVVEGQNPAEIKTCVFLASDVAALLRPLIPEIQAGALCPASQGALLDLARKITEPQEIQPVQPAPIAIAAIPAAPARPTAPASSPPRPVPAAPAVVRVESSRLDLLLNLVGEVVIARNRLEHQLADLSRLRHTLLLSRSQLIRIGADAAPPARALVEISDQTGEMIGQLTRLVDLFSSESGQFSKITARLQEEILRARMVPVAVLFRRLLRVARETAAREGKQVDFQTQGGEARLDKAILDQIYRPLLHIVRNAVAHGIEPPAQRLSQGKPAAGQIRVRAVHEFNLAVLEIADDGRGLDYEAIRAEAVRHGLIGADAAPDPELLTGLVFEPGLSTASRASEVSGRGVGLDVVRQEIARLNGTIQVLSQPGLGCTFVIRLPLTLAINRAMLVGVGEETLALPLTFIDRVLETSSTRLTRSGEEEFASVDGELVPLIRLRQLLGLPGGQGTNGALVLARVADRTLVLLVDRVLQKQDIVVKPLGPLLAGHKLYCGATVSGDGRVILIVSIPGVLECGQGSARAGTQYFLKPQAIHPE